MCAATTTGRGTRTRTTMVGTMGGTSAWAAVREAFVAEGGPEAVRAVGAWLRGVWGKVRRTVATVAREFSPVLPCRMADVVPVLPVVESVPSVSYASPTCTVSTDCQRWVHPADVARVVSAVQRVEAERVAAGAEVVYGKAKGRYHVVADPATYTGTTYRRATVGKATRYHAV